jgi:hypothetical protein
MVSMSFDAVLTADHDIEIPLVPVAVIVLVATSDRLEALQALVDDAPSPVSGASAPLACEPAGLVMRMMIPEKGETSGTGVLYIVVVDLARLTNEPRAFATQSAPAPFVC